MAIDLWRRFGTTHCPVDFGSQKLAASCAEKDDSAQGCSSCMCVLCELVLTVQEEGDIGKRTGCRSFLPCRLSPELCCVLGL